MYHPIDMNGNRAAHPPSHSSRKSHLKKFCQVLTFLALVGFIGGCITWIKYPSQESDSLSDMPKTAMSSSFQGEEEGGGSRIPAALALAEEDLSNFCHEISIEDPSVSSMDTWVSKYDKGPAIQLAQNVTAQGTVEEGQYKYYQVCVARHNHHHRVNLKLEILDPETEASLYISAIHPQPKLDKCTWLSKDPGNDVISIPTYVDDFVKSGSNLLYVGVYGASTKPTPYRLMVDITNVPEADLKKRGSLRGSTVLPPRS